MPEIQGTSVSLSWKDRISERFVAFHFLIVFDNIKYLFSELIFFNINIYSEKRVF